MKRLQESEPALISVIYSAFLLHLSEVKYHWSKYRKGEKNCQSTVYDKGLDRIPKVRVLVTNKRRQFFFGKTLSIDIAP